MLLIEGDINSELEALFNNEEVYKTVNKEMVMDQYLLKWLGDFKIRNPDDYFLQMGIDDDDIVCNIQSPLDFLLSTLEVFGLPKGYLEGAGHHLNWDKKAQEAANARGKKKKGPSKVVGGGKLKKAQEKARQAKLDKSKPTHFDLAPFQQALKRFLTISSKSRSSMRAVLLSHQDAVRSVFKDDHGEGSFKRCVDVNELAPKLQ